MSTQLIVKTAPVPHFEITRELFEALTASEVEATITALNECGLLKLPYAEQTIRFSVEDYACSLGWGGLDPASRGPNDVRITVACTDIRIEDGKTYATTEDVFHCERDDGAVWTVDWHRELYQVQDWPSAMPVQEENLPLMKFYNKAGLLVVPLLVAALATKNVAKNTAINKRVGRGIGNGKFRAANGAIRVSVTTLDVPKVYNETGRRVRMHLRRGHVHRWRKGDGTLVAKFLPAVLVNKDQAVTAPVTPEYKVTA